MPETTTRLGLPLMAAAQAQKHVTHNEALELIDSAVQLVLDATGTQSPPADPQVGETHAIGEAPTGSWTDYAGYIAQWQSTQWIFVLPKAGWRAWHHPSGMMLVFDGNEWSDALQNLQGIGISAISDSTNKLTVASAASLFTHLGAGHQIKVNKSTQSETASLLFQSDWSGHAEMGLAGDNDFRVKVSADGSNWVDAIGFDAATGTANGAAVQSHPFDTAQDRLLKTGAFGLGATDDISGAITDGDTYLGNGFYYGAGDTANFSSFPSSSSSYGPFLNLNSRLDETTVSTRRMFFEGSVPVVSASDDNGATWGNANRLYGQENIVGAVSENAGQPTGAIIESGENANGQFIRWADGTQFCTNSNAPITTDPAAFVGTVTSIDGDKLRIGRWF